MPLKIVHIDKDGLDQDAEVRAFWENVLKPKWEAKAKADAEKLFTKLRHEGAPEPTALKRKK